MPNQNLVGGLNSFIVNDLSSVSSWYRDCHIGKHWKPRLGGSFMANLGPKTVDERSAAILLGLAPPEVRWFSRVLGLGSKQDGGETARIVFTYDELKRLSSAAAASAK
jgi:hypothetical protein